jgi:hypothetical protein
LKIFAVPVEDFASNSAISKEKMFTDLIYQLLINSRPNNIKTVFFFCLNQQFNALRAIVCRFSLIYHRRSVERSRDQINKTPSFFILNLLKIFVGTIEIIACMFTALVNICTRSCINNLSLLSEHKNDKEKKMTGVSRFWSLGSAGVVLIPEAPSSWTPERHDAGEKFYQDDRRREEFFHSSRIDISLSTPS